MTLENRNRAIGMLHNCSISYVVRHFNVCRKTIRLLQRRHSQGRVLEEEKRLGPMIKTSPAEDRDIVYQHLRNRFLSATQTAKSFPGLKRISRHTVRRILKAIKLLCRRPLQRFKLTLRHKQKRMVWARLQEQKSVDDWSKLFFLDESRFYLQRHDGHENA